SGEVLVLDMGEPVRIVDIARRLAARAAEPIEIVFTGLRPGEKMSEQLLGEGERDDRPYHPLIRHVPAAPLPPEAVAWLDGGRAPAQLRADLASCARQPNGGAVTARIGAALTGVLADPRQDGSVAGSGHQAAQP
ncbi:MAG: polysaccharide biosynthesis protein, partial [Actinomycetota bacterium]|nr:polysaccharide biosynthesis protein [Actinomycetota bacterium]